MERLVYIDILKGIAIILVVMGHLFVPYTDYLDSTVNLMIYSVHMPLFIFLSGFVFHLSQGKHSVRITIMKRILSLLLPFFCFSAVYCFVNDISFSDMLLKNEMHNGYWFTLVLFEIILISIVIEMLTKRIRGGQNGKVAVDLILNVVLILILLIIAKIELIPEPYKTLFSTDKVAKFYMFFQMGKLVNTYSMFGSLFKKQWVYTFCVVAYFFLFTKYGYDLQGVNAMSFILPVCGIIVLTNMVEKNQMLLNSHNILASIGKNSLEIYLVHFLVLSLIPKEIIDSCGSVYLQLFVLLLLSVICIMVSLIMAQFIHSSDILDFLLFGKGSYLKKIISKIK